MKILVFSDSHGCSAPLRTAIEAHRDAEAVIFLGDGAAEALDVLADYPSLARCILAGNCDSRLALAARGADLTEECVLDFGGKRFFCLHGHTRGVKMGMDRVLYRASELEADVILFGHTHIALNEYAPDPASPSRRILLFNPGSVGRSLTHTYGVIHVVNGAISAGHGRASL